MATKKYKDMTPEEKSAEMRRRVLMRYNGRDKTEVSPEMLELVRHACAEGATVLSICAALDISEKTFYKIMGKSPEFAAAVKAGRGIEHDRLVNKLVEVALKGNVTALIFALKSRHNYNDAGNGTAVIENKVSVNFVLPDSLPPEAYLKTLTAKAEIIQPEQVTRALARPGVKGKLLRELAMEGKDNGREE